MVVAIVAEVLLWKREVAVFLDYDVFVCLLPQNFWMLLHGGARGEIRAVFLPLLSKSSDGLTVGTVPLHYTREEAKVTLII